MGDFHSEILEQSVNIKTDFRFHSDRKSLTSVSLMCKRELGSLIKFVEESFHLRFKRCKRFCCIGYQQTVIDDHLYFLCIELQTIFSFQNLSYRQHGVYCLSKFFLSRAIQL